MTYGPYLDAFNGGLHRSFREQIRERIPPGEEFRPPRYLYLGRWPSNSLHSISVAGRLP